MSHVSTVSDRGGASLLLILDGCMSDGVEEGEEVGEIDAEESTEDDDKESQEDLVKSCCSFSCLADFDGFGSFDDFDDLDDFDRRLSFEVWEMFKTDVKSLPICRPISLC